MNLLGKAMDKEFWKQVAEKDCYKSFRNELNELWEGHSGDKPIAQLNYSDFKLFWTTGNRSVYEGCYFSRRKALGATALLCLVYPEEEKYLTKLMDLIYAVCDEYTWCLPAHQGKLEENNNCRIDLFASETGFALSEIYTMLEDRLEPLIKNRIQAELERRIVTPFIAVENYGWWERGTSNWTAVCTGSVAGTLMLMRPALIDDAMKERFAKSMACYLSGFENDGMCLEGCGYWHYGFGFFTVYADMIRTFTNGEVDYFKDAKVKNIATFIQKMYLSGRSSVSFADAGTSCSYHIGLVHYLKDEYPSEVVVYKPEYSYNTDGCERFCHHLRAVTWFNEEYYAHPAPDNVSGEYYASDSEWLIKRTSAYGFAAKGGHNNEPHNNNDVGNFIFAKNGRQMIMDVGAGSYCRQYFSNERYTFNETCSRGHNLPIINGVYQSDGKAFAAKDTKFENGVFETEIAAAYNCDGLESIKRTFSFTEDTVTLTDKFVYTGEGDIVDRMVSRKEPKMISDSEVQFDEAVVSFDPEKYECTLTSEQSRFREAFIYYVNFKLKAGVDTFTCVIK